MERWYLIDESTKPNMIGGFENQAFRDYKNDAFMESLSTDIASTVLLYNHDLSRKKKIRARLEGFYSFYSCSFLYNETELSLRFVFLFCVTSSALRH